MDAPWGIVAKLLVNPLTPVLPRGRLEASDMWLGEWLDSEKQVMRKSWVLGKVKLH